MESSQVVKEVVFFALHCPLCGSKIEMLGSDVVGSMQPYCRECKQWRIVKVDATGKIVIEFAFSLRHNPPDNLGVRAKSS